jgi:hypothetical protein
MLARGRKADFLMAWHVGSPPLFHEIWAFHLYDGRWTSHRTLFVGAKKTAGALDHLRMHMRFASDFVECAVQADW